MKKVSYRDYDWLRHHPRTNRGLTMAAPLDIVLSEYNVVQPDVVCFEPERLRALSARPPIRIPPDLAIEVLSPGTVLTDRGQKMQLFARFSVREYWLVDPEAGAVEGDSVAGLFRSPLPGEFFREFRGFCV